MEARQEEQTRKQEEQSRRAEEKRVQREEAAAEKERARAAKEDNRKFKDGKGKRLGGLFGAVAAGAPAASADTALAATETEPEIEPIVATTAATTTTSPGLTSDSSHPTDVHFLTTVPNPEEAAEYHEPQQNIEVPIPIAEAAVVEDPEVEDPIVATTTTERAATTAATEPLTTTTATELPATTQATSPQKGDSKVKSWLKSRFRTSSKAQNDLEDDGKKPGFIGGAALTGAGVGDGSPDRAKSDSMREVAMVGRSSTREDEDLYGSSEKAVSPVDGPAERAASRSPSISSMSSSDVDEAGKEKAPRGRRGFKERLLGKSATKESADDNDEFEEARDTFDEEKLTPPPKLTTLTGTSTKSSNSPSRERSKFTEDL